MRLLDRYLFRELLLPLAYCLVGFLIAFIAFDLFRNIDDFQKNQLTGGEILQYYFNLAPEFLTASYIMPMSLLLGMLYALSNHSRHNEVTAMRAAGISLSRIALPYFVTGALFSLAVFYINEQLLPDGVEAADRLMYRHAPDQSKGADKIWRRNFAFVNQVANRTWRLGAFHQQAYVMIQPQFDWRRPDGTRMQLSADRARWVNHQWLFVSNVEVMEFSAESVRLGTPPSIFTTNLLILPALTETPRIIKSEIKISAINESFRSLRRVQLSSAQILEYLKLNPRLERRRADSLRTLLHSQLAKPWICLVVVFIAVPCGATPGRRNVFVGVASSVFVCFLFFILKDVALAFGSNGILPPAAAAWMPNLLFTVTGIVLMRRVR